MRRDLVIQRSWRALLERMKAGLAAGCLQARARSKPPCGAPPADTPSHVAPGARSACPCGLLWAHMHSAPRRAAPQVDAKPLKAGMAPAVAAAQERVKLCLLGRAREATRSALEDLGARCAALGRRPGDLDGYMAYLVGGVALDRGLGGGWGERGGATWTAMAYLVRAGPRGVLLAVCQWFVCGGGGTCWRPWGGAARHPKTPPPRPQTLHTEQVDVRKALAAGVAAVNDMYDVLAAHEQKVKGRGRGERVWWGEGRQSTIMYDVLAAHEQKARCVFGHT